MTNKEKAAPGATGAASDSNDHADIVWEEIPKGEVLNPPGGGVFMMQLSHDDWCLTLKTGSGLDCHCDPDIKLLRMKGGKS